MKKIILTAIISITAVCCSTIGTEEVFVETQQISLTWKGDIQISYNPDKCQLGYNSHNNEYRVYDDNLANWFTVRCSEKPCVEGQTLRANVSWTGSSTTKTFKGLQFVVSRADETGRVWLWNDSDKIGIVIRNL